MNVNIDNFAPKADLIHIHVKHKKEFVDISIERDVLGVVCVYVELEDETGYRMILGKADKTIKL